MRKGGSGTDRLARRATQYDVPPALHLDHGDSMDGVEARTTPGLARFRRVGDRATLCTSDEVELRATSHCPCRTCAPPSEPLSPDKAYPMKVSWGISKVSSSQRRYGKRAMGWGTGMGFRVRPDNRLHRYGMPLVAFVWQAPSFSRRFPSHKTLLHNLKNADNLKSGRPRRSRANVFWKMSAGKEETP